jgi:hypothetical protein
MAEFRIKDFLDRLSKLGLMLSATRMADGSIRLTHWRWLSFYENEAEIKTVWDVNLNGQENRLQDVARYLELTQRRARSSRT